MANHKTMQRIEIQQVVTTPASYPHGDKTRKAPNGFVCYSMGSKVFYYGIDPTQDMGLINALVVGERYNVTCEEWLKGLRTAYKWVSTQHIGTGNVYPPKVVPAAPAQNVSSLRNDVEDLIWLIAADNPTPEMKALLELLCVEMVNKPDLFGGAA